LASQNIQVRIALHGLEAIEGTPIGAGTAFKTNPPFSFGLSHAGNAARWVVASAVRSLLPTFMLATPTPADVANPYTLAGYARASAPQQYSMTVASL
jgi:hypothetical protein